MMDIEVILLDGVEEFLDTPACEIAGKSVWTMTLLRKMGSNLQQPYCKAVRGRTGLYELRVKFASDIVRLFYFEHNQKTYIVTSGYVKKEQKLNKGEIEKAYRLMSQYIEVHSHD